MANAVNFEEVRARIREFLKRYPAAEWGTAHIVLSDYNLTDYWLLQALIETHKVMLESYWANGTIGEVLSETMNFLFELAEIPEIERDPEAM